MTNRTLSHSLPRPPRMPRSAVAALVLAAGSSSRMGAAKMLLPLAGKPLLAHTLGALRASRVGEIVVVLGGDAERIRREVPLDSTRVVVNPEPRQGMSSSIRAGLDAASPDAEAFLIVLGDQPLVRGVTFDTLVARHAATHARVVVPTFRGTRGNPVLFDRSLSAELRAVRGDVGGRDVVWAHADEVVEVPVDDPAVLLDVDTPEDLSRIERALREGTPLDQFVRK